MNFDLNRKLPADFYLDDVTSVAKNLLGKIFVKNANGVLLAGRIIEVEAYDGVNDEASHSYRGMTERNKVMFSQGGILYVYFTYGVHFCCNVVTAKSGYGAAVLLRSLEPMEGIDAMIKNRYGKLNASDKEKLNLVNGPGKICKAFSIERQDNGTDLRGDCIFILDAPNVNTSDIVESKRVGIKKSTDYLWRFYIKNKIVSKK